MISPMGRKRQANFSLPPRMHLKSGTYYYVTNEKPRRWISLGKDISASKREWARIETETSGEDSISRLIDKWLSTEEFYARPVSTQKVYNSVAKQLKAVFGDMAVQDIKPGNVALWMDSHKSKTQANMGKSVLSSVMKVAVRYGKIDHNPCQEVAVHEIEGRKRYVTDDEFNRIRSHANDALKAIMDIAYLTSSRISDVLAIRLSAWSSDGLLVRQIKTKKLQLYQRTPELEESINRAKAIPRPFRGLFLFCTTTGKQYHQNTVREWWVSARELAGVDDVHFHDIRGKSATDAEEDGEDYQALLGHSTKKMSDKYLKIEKPQIVKPRRRIVERSITVVESTPETRSSS